MARTGKWNNTTPLLPRRNLSDIADPRIARENLELGNDDDAIFDSITLNDLTNNKLTRTDSNNLIISADLDDFVAGTANQLTVTDDGDGSITLSFPNDVTINSLTVGSLNGVLKATAGLISGSATTSDVPEGTNLYYTQSRFDTAFSNKDTDDLTEGVVNFWYTNERVDDRVAALVTDTSSVAWTYNDVAGTLEANVTATGVDHGSLSGLSDDDHTQYHNDARADTWLGTKSTTDLSEGTNLYYTQSRFDTAFGAKSTTDLSEGTNLYYTQARFDSAFTAKDTDDLSEGTTNLYFTNERVDDRVDALIQNSSTITWTYNDGANTLTGSVVATGIDHGSLSGLADDDHTQYHTDSRALTWIGTRSTSDLPEGTNLYYTDARVQAYISAGDGIDINGSGQISADINTTNLQFTATEINTIQDITTTSDVTFGSLIISGSSSPTDTPCFIQNTDNQARVAIFATGGDFSGSDIGHFTGTKNATVSVIAAGEDVNELASIRVMGINIGTSTSGGIYETYATRSTLAQVKAGTYTALQNGDRIGQYKFLGDDGTDGRTVAADIICDVDGTVATNRVPGKISIRTMDSSGNFATRVVVENDGKVGVGTTLPDAPLHVQNYDTAYTWPPNTRTAAIFEGSSIGTVVQLVSDSTDQTEIWFGDTDNQNRGRVRYNHATDELSLYSGGVERITVNSTGITTVKSTTDASSSTTGSLITSGGLGVAKKAFFGTGIYVGSSSNTSEYELNTFRQAELSVTWDASGLIVAAGYDSTIYYSKIGNLVTLIFREIAVPNASIEPVPSSAPLQLDTNLDSFLRPAHTHYATEPRVQSNGIISADNGLAVIDTDGSVFIYSTLTQSSFVPTVPYNNGDITVYQFSTSYVTS